MSMAKRKNWANVSLLEPMAPEGWLQSRSDLQVWVLHHRDTFTNPQHFPFFPSSFKIGIFGPGDKVSWPGFVKAAKKGHSVFMLGKGENLMDWTYVDNVALAHLQAAEKLALSNTDVAGQVWLKHTTTLHYTTLHYTTPHLHSHCMCLFFRHFSLQMTSLYHSGTWWHMCGGSWVILHPSTRYPTMWHGSWQSYLNFSCGLSRLSIAGTQLTHGYASGILSTPSLNSTPLSHSTRI